MEQELVIKTPGKLMIAGEFAVLEPHQKALVTAVNRFVYATLRDATVNKISLPDFQLHELLWEWDQAQIRFATSDRRLDFVANAMATTFAYVLEKEIPLKPIHLTVQSELADESGLKYGLGSSAAVVTAVVEAILTRFMEKQFDRKLVFKLAAIAHVKTQGSGSGADIAASAYGGLLAYTSFQAEWLLEQIASHPSVSSLVEQEWRYLSIHPLPTPIFVQFLVGWTGTAASTKALVARMDQMKQSDPHFYASFMEESERAVQKMSKGLTQQDEKTLFSGVFDNHQALRMLGKRAAIPVETEALAALSLCAQEAKGAGKLSGAGGGDCGIAFLPAEANAAALHACWRKQSIRPLDLQMYDREEGSDE